MIELASHALCTGCTSCANSCSHAAIRMQTDGEGFLYPVIDKEICVKCGLCMKRCPVVVPVESKNRKEPVAYAAWSYKDRIVSSSGGAFSAFARSVLKNKGIVWGAAFDAGLKCRHSEANTLDTLIKLRGSKYVQSDLGMSFSHIKKDLKQGREVLFCGTSCQIAGLYAYLQKDYANLLTLDLVCHGVPSNAIFQAYLSKLGQRIGTDVDDFEFRNRDGWGKSSFAVVRGKYRALYGVDNLYMRAFDKAALLRPSCYSCPYTRLPRIGDCTLADFWGIGQHGKPFKHNVLKGVSLILVNNEKGEKAISRLEDVFMEQRILDEALKKNHNITHSSVVHPQREAVILAFLNPNKTLESIAKEFDLTDNSLKGKVKELASKYHVFDIIKSVYNIYKSL